MPGPAIGLMLPYDSEPGPFARLAEDLGFDVLATGEHVLFRRPILNAFVALSAAAASTSRIRLMSALTLLPLYPVALAAKLASSLDVISGGRLDLGVGVGGEVPEEFAACGVALAGRGRRTDAAIVALRRYFDRTLALPAGEPDLLPRPVQQPAPPIWVGGRSDAALRRAAEHGDGWVPYLMTPAQIAARASKLTARLGVRAVVFVGLGPRSSAADDATRFVAQLYDLPAERVRRYVVAGDRAAVIDQLAEFRAAGADSLLLNLCAAGEAADRMAGTIASSVLPALNHLSSNRKAPS